MNPKKILQLARRWQKTAALKRKRITSPDTEKAGKGHFVVYSADERRFLLPLEYLNKEIMKALFDMAEEEFGLPSNGPLTLPCEAEFLEYAIALIKHKVTEDVEKVLLTSISGHCGSSSFHLQHPQISSQLPICSF